MKHIASGEQADAWTFDPEGERPGWVSDAVQAIPTIVFEDENSNPVAALPGQVVVSRDGKISVWNADAFASSFSQDA